MKLNQIEDLNKKLQDLAAKCSEAIPGENLVEHISNIIRSLKAIDTRFLKLIQSKSDMTFFTTLEKLEEQLDEVVFALDQIHLVNTKYEINVLNQLIIDGYEMLSIYSMACDSMIEKRVNKEKDML
jgi:hypothetical protein